MDPKELLYDDNSDLLSKLQERIKPMERMQTETEDKFKRRVPEGVVNIKPALKRHRDASDTSTEQWQALRTSKTTKLNRVSFNNL